MPQTIPINGDNNFVELDAFMDSILKKKGFDRVPQTGSTSWKDPRIQPASAAVKFKLCFFGPNNIVFGVRQEFASECEFDAPRLDCPDSFTVFPSTVQFISFAVSNDDLGRRRLSETLERFH